MWVLGTSLALTHCCNARLDPRIPTYISTEYEDGNVIATFDDVEAFAYADNEFEAVDLLCKKIIILYEELLEDSGNLGPLPKKWLAILQNFIKCNRRNGMCCISRLNLQTLSLNLGMIFMILASFC